MASPMIRVESFCALSGNSQWQNWLYKYDITLYNELIAHLRVSRGCGHNREKMIDLMGKIEARPGGRDVIVEFLRANFPSMLDYAGAPVSKPAPSAVPGVQLPQVPFEWNGNSLTFPKRAVLDNPDPAALRAEVDRLVSDKLRYDFVILQDKAYVEYVPANHAKILDQIPVSNWKVSLFKRLWQVA